MADGVFNVAKGRVNQLVENVEQNSPTGCEIVLVILEAAEADATLEDYDTLSALLAAGGNTEWASGQYTRTDWTAAALSRTVDDTNNRQDAAASDVTWNSATGNATVKAVVCYDPTGSSADTALVPLTHHDFVVTPNGGNITAQVSTFFRAS